jgi:apolipoprotein D and lipocalin family protein
MKTFCRSLLLPVLFFVSFSSHFEVRSVHAFGKSSPDLPELQVVDHFDVSRYLGLWYEIASFPQSFQKGCTGTTAEYSLINESTVRVVNKCYLNSLTGELKEAHGKAKIPDVAVPSKLKVSFFWPFSGAYWVIELGDNYEYAVVGHPNRNYLWILSRTPHMDETLIGEIIARQAAKGFEMTRLQRTVQP